MTRDLKPYPAMKDSGMPWLGEVPEHWEVKRLKYFMREVDERSPSGEEELLSVSHITGVTPRREKNVTMFLAASNAGHKICRTDDVVVNTMWAWMGALGVARQAGLVSPSYGVYRPLRAEGALPSYMDRLLRTPTYVAEYVRRSTGINTSRLRLYPDQFLAVPVVCPPLNEQAATVRFLDHADRRIRRLISAKLKLINLLEEQKQAIIHRGITRGLDPNVRLKPSGVEWLGEIPEHWEVVALRHRYSQCLGKMLDSKRMTGSHSLRYLRNTDVKWDRINVRDLPSMDIEPEEYGRYTVQNGDLVVCEGGEVGRCALWRGELDVCGFQKALHRLRPRKAAQDMPRFMYYVLRAAAKGNAFNDGHVSTIAHLTGDKLRAHRFPFPPNAEQEVLVEFLDSALQQVDDAMSAARREVSILREYRTRLIADVVTGKLDVREAAAVLPDEAEEPEMLDEVDALDEGDDADEAEVDDANA